MSSELSQLSGPGLAALLAAALSAGAALAVAVYRAGVDKKLQTRLKIADARLPAYLALWSCMAPVSPTASTSLTKQVRRELDAALRKAFFDDGGGLLLSHSALSRYIVAVDALNDARSSDEQVRESFSALRTQMKTDLSVYTEDEAGRSVRRSP